jgi:hypothetical protein
MPITKTAADLQLSTEDVRWLISTGQLSSRRVNGEERVDYLDLHRLIRAYKSVAHRRRA